MLNEEALPGEQGSAAWLMERVGKVTASNFKHVMDVLKNGNPSAKRQQYLLDIVIERLTGKPTEHYMTDPMMRGVEMEPFARMRYEAESGNLVTESGFIHHHELAFVGGSPDGLVGDDGMIEIKCPTTRTHIEQWLSGECEHLPQIQGLLWITGRAWCDFISYDERLPQERLQYCCKRIMRDDTYIELLSAGVIKFLSEVDGMLVGIEAKSASGNEEDPT